MLIVQFRCFSPAGEDEIQFVTLRPEESANLTLVLTNTAPSEDRYSFIVNTAVTGSSDADFFQYTLSPETVVLGQSMSIETSIEITLSSEITEGATVTFTVIAETNSNNDDFIQFFLVATNRPPPLFTDNVRTSL